MAFHALARRRGADRPHGATGSCVLRGAAVLGLFVLLGGLALPVIGLALEGDAAPFCRGKGRCCCADASAGSDDRTCLRRGCSCAPPGSAVAASPLRTDAILPAGEPLAITSAAVHGWTSRKERPLLRHEPPPVPPPRRPLA